MNDMAKVFFVAGVVMIGVGVVLSLAGKIPWLGKLPGDILVRKNNVTFYFPWVTCLLLSAVFSLFLYVVNKR